MQSEGSSRALDGVSAEELSVAPDLQQPHRSELGIAVAAVGLGILLYLAADTLVDLGAGLIPASGEVASRGTAFGSFREVAPAIVRRSGLVIVCSAGCLAFARNFASWRPAARAYPVALGATVGAIALWTGWVSFYHNGFPTNARIHWVDFFTSRSDDYFYAAGRIPHQLFYEQPYVWQMINAVLIAAVCLMIARRLDLGKLATLAFVISPPLSGNLLNFVDTAEDVYLSVLLLLVVVWAHLTRSWLGTGFALALAGLGRPSFLVLVPCLGAAEVAATARLTRWRLKTILRSVDWSFVLRSTAVASAVTAGAQVVFSWRGDRYFLTGGRLIDTGPLAAAVPQTVDGFTISAFSGAYALHALWALPLVLLVGTTGNLVLRHADIACASTSYFVVFGALATTAVHESQPLLYYNVRYLTYVWPFVFVGAWMGYAAIRSRLQPPVRVASVALLVLGVMVIPANPIDQRSRLADRPEQELVDHADVLRGLAEERMVVSTLGSRSSRNFIAYVFRRGGSAIRVADEETVGPKLVISSKEAPYSPARPALETDSLLIHIVSD